MEPKCCGICRYYEPARSLRCPRVRPRGMAKGKGRA